MMLRSADQGAGLEFQQEGAESVGHDLESAKLLDELLKTLDEAN